MLSPNGGETLNVGAQRSITWIGAEPADVWLSVDGGANYALLETGAGGGASNAIPLRVPHLPTRFARIQFTPADAAIGGSDHSDSTFTIQASVALLRFTGELEEDGAQLAWETDLEVEAEGIAGYRLYRLGSDVDGNGTRIWA